MPPKTNGHALIGGSNLLRALNCGPSIRLGENIDEEESIYAKEGSAAHLLLEKKVKARYGIPFDEDTSSIENPPQDMEEATNEALNYINEKFEKLELEGKHPFISSELQVEFADVVPNGYGTSDIVIV